MGQPLRALFVEDSPDDVELLVRELARAGYEVDHTRVDSPDALTHALDHEDWDLICADYTMPGFRGTTALRMVRDRDADLPFIFVSGTIGEDIAVAAMEAGAQDYVIKGNIKRFVPAVARELREAEVRRERERLEAELRQAQRLESVGRLAGGLAHDFNNLLTVIRGYVDLLLTDEDVERRHGDDVAEIRRAVDRGASLTRQLLAFSRQQILELRVIDLNDVVRDMEPMLRRLLGEDIRLIIRLAPELGRVKADFGQLQQVLMNFAVNARDAMPDGGTLLIETRDTRLDTADASAGAPEGHYVTLVVRDTGVGMDEETRAQIFDPFFTTKEPGKGTGLGLPTAYGIITQSGGHIRVDSKPNGGTTFTIRLPRTDEPLEDSGSPAKHESAPTGSEIILLVEDEAPVRELIERVLTGLGYTLHTTTSGEEALRWLGSPDRPIDLVLTDAVLPDMTAEQLVAAIDSRRPGTRIVCMPARPDATLADELSRLGAGVLPKPFTSFALARSVREALDADA